MTRLGVMRSCDVLMGGNSSTPIQLSSLLFESLWPEEGLRGRNHKENWIFDFRRYEEHTSVTAFQWFYCTQNESKCAEIIKKPDMVLQCLYGKWYYNTPSQLSEWFSSLAADSELSLAFTLVFLSSFLTLAALSFYRGSESLAAMR